VLILFFQKLVSMTLFKVDSNSLGFEFIRLFDVPRINSTNTINHVGLYAEREEKTHCLKAVFDGTVVNVYIILFYYVVRVRV